MGLHFTWGSQLWPLLCLRNVMCPIKGFANTSSHRKDWGHQIYMYLVSLKLFTMLLKCFVGRVNIQDRFQPSADLWTGVQTQQWVCRVGESIANYLRVIYPSQVDCPLQLSGLTMPWRAFISDNLWMCNDRLFQKISTYSLILWDKLFYLTVLRIE